MDNGDCTEMRVIGTLKGKSGRSLMLDVEKDIPYEIGTVLDLTLDTHRKRRSRDANAYFHVLVDELRQVLNISFSACKNYLITAYGQIEYIGDEPAIIKTNVPPEQMQEQETLHCKPIAVKNPEEGVYWYRVYRGSHTYNTKEMSTLLEGTVSECQLQGIETMTPAEIARLKVYEKYSHR